VDGDPVNGKRVFRFETFGNEVSGRMHATAPGHGASQHQPAESPATGMLFDSTTLTAATKAKFCG